MPDALPPKEIQRLRALRFLNLGHFLDHYILLVFPTVVIGLEAVYGRSYGELLILSTAAFTAFGIFALPFGWLADHWSRRNMIAIFFIGTGISAIAVGLAPNFTTLAIALFGVGIFSAIYHPVGIPMVIDNAVNRGRTMSWNGVCGNVGVSVAAGCTGAITTVLGWRYAFFIPAVVLVGVGIAYLRMMPDEGGARRAAQPNPQDVALDLRTTIAVVSLFMLLAISSGLVFNAMTITLPKIVDVRAGQGIPLVVVSGLATAVFLCGALAQLSIGRLVDRVQPHYLVAAVALTQFVGIVWVHYAVGWQMLAALALSIAAIYAQITVNDIVLARYTPSSWRGRIYALRFFLIFAPAGLAVWGIGRLYDAGGVDLVLWVTMLVAGVFAANSVLITLLVGGVESRRARRTAAAPAE